MKKIFVLIISFLFFACSVNAAQEYNTPIPAEDDEVTSSGPDTKYSLATEMRFNAFDEAEEILDIDIPEERQNVQIYKLSQNENYIQKIKIPNTKLIEYTNGSYDIIYKDTPFVVFRYDKDGVLQSISKITNKGKAPFFVYHYNVDKKIQEIEIQPDRYHSYVYNLDGILTKYIIDKKVYAVNGKMILRRKSNFF